MALPELPAISYIGRSHHWLHSPELPYRSSDVALAIDLIESVRQTSQDDREHARWIRAAARDRDLALAAPTITVHTGPRQGRWIITILQVWNAAERSDSAVAARHTSSGAPTRPPS